MDLSMICKLAYCYEHSKWPVTVAQNFYQIFRPNRPTVIKLLVVISMFSDILSRHSIQKIHI